jgi:hypothetical protein
MHGRNLRLLALEAELRLAELRVRSRAISFSVLWAD